MKKKPLYIEFISESPAGHLDSASTITHTFYFDTDRFDYNDLDFQHYFLITVCKIFQKSLACRFNNAIVDTYLGAKHFFKADSDFQQFKAKKGQIFTTTVYFDASPYWYDNQNKTLKKALLRSCYSLTMYNFPNTVLHIRYGFNWFSNHLVRERPFFDENEDFYFFEPAAKLNREMMREFAKNMKHTFEGLVVEFETEGCWTYPYDEFGFLDGADNLLVSPPPANGEATLQSEN